MKTAAIPAAESRRTISDSDQIALIREILRLKIPLRQFRRAVELIIDGR